MKSAFICSFAVLISFLSLSCSSSKFVNLDNLKTELNLKDFPEQKDYPEADALVLTESHDVNVYINEKYELETVESIKRVTKLFKNIENHASIEIHAYNGDRVMNLHARTIKPDGTVIELKKDDFHTITGEGDDYVFYSDSKKIKFTFPAIEKNSIVEYGYTLYKSYPFVMGAWYIQGSTPKLLNTFRLTAPLILVAKGLNGAGWTWRYKAFNCDVPQANFERNISASNAVLDASVSFEWKKQNVPAFEPEPAMPPEENYLQFVKFIPSDWEKWNDISSWYYNNFFKDQLIITDGIIEKANELTKNTNDETEKIRKIYSFIQSLRYIAIELGEGGLKPTEPQKVLERKYGDCKDKSILLLSLLKSIGIKAKPVLVLTSDRGTIDKNVPYWNFNHMIVRATTRDGKNYWMDPTAEKCSLGDVPYQCEGVNALVLNDDGTSILQTTPSSLFKDNVKEIKISVKFSDLDNTDFDISIKFKGEYNSRYRNYFNEKTHEEMLKFCKTLVANNYLNAEVKDYSFLNENSIDSNLVLDFKLKVPNAIEKQEDLVFLNIDPFKLIDEWAWLAKEKRNYDIDFEFPHTVDKTIEVELPDNLKIRNLPSSTILSEEGLFYNKDYKTEGNNHLTIREYFSIKSKYIDADKYEKVRSFFDKMKAKLNEKIILTSKSVSN